MNKIVCFLIICTFYYSCNCSSVINKEIKSQYRITLRDVGIGMYGEDKSKHELKYERINPDKNVVNRIKINELFKNEDCSYAHYVQVAKFYFKGEEYHLYETSCLEDEDGRSLLYVYMPKLDEFVLRIIET